MKAIAVYLLLILSSLPSAFAEEAKAEEKKALGHESSLGYVVTGGNSSSETTSFKQATEYDWSYGLLKLTGHYIQTQGLDVTTNKTNQTAENWSAALRYEKVITPERFNLFAQHGWRGDRFQNVREAKDTDVGAKYFWLKNDTSKFFTELGYRYTKELYVTADPEKGIHPEYHFVRLFNQYDYSYSKSVNLGLWIEFLPDINDFAESQRINYSPYLTSVLSDLFSLKVAYEGRYRFKAAAPGLKYQDYTFTTSIIAKY
ncbi:MAG: DUF481 domain-containing protein [Bdellovibrionales bacterium]|nr:DUF481 domain-containing protein [Bdellovibrionales bacterium]